MQLNDEHDDRLLGDGDSFHFFLPIQKSEGKDGQRIIQGIASTEDRDLQGEVVSLKGIDTAYFLKHGYINDDHKEGPEHKVGEPTECKHTPKGLWIKGFLYKGKPRSDQWWEHLQALEHSGSKRKVGFSIQGKIIRRQGKTILKCWLQDVAITASPVNTNTWAEIVKSLSKQTWCLNPEESKCKSCGGCPIGDKALSTGGQGSVLVPESLEGRAKVQTYKSIDRVTFNEAVQLIQQRGYSVTVAKAMADAIFSVHGIH